MALDLSKQTNRQRVIGSISGWDKLTTSKLGNQELPTSDHDYTIADLYTKLKELLMMFDKEQLTYIEALVNEHVNNFDNPHRTNLALLNTSVFKEFYNTWLEYGNNGDEEDFLKIIFQYVKIADWTTTEKGEKLDEVPSVYTANKLVVVHNEDENAHENLIKSMFPGEEVRVRPNFAVHGFIGMPQSAKVERDSIIRYVDKTGYVSVAEKNTIPTDYSFEEPAFPIFGKVTNLIGESEDITNTTHYTLMNCTLKDSTYVADILDPTKKAKMVVESLDTTNKEHLIGYLPGVNVEQGKIYTVSAFVFPVNRNCLGMRFGSEVLGDNVYINFDFETKKHFISTTAGNTEIESVIEGNMCELPSGWYRVYATVKVNKTGKIYPKFYPLDIYDGDFNYKGNGESGFCITGINVTETNMVAPYVKSANGTSEILESTYITVDASSWYNADRGTVVASVRNIPNMVTNTTKYIYSFGSSISKVSLIARYTGTRKNSIYITASEDNSEIYRKSTNSTRELDSTIVQSFDNSSIDNNSTATFGSTDGFIDTTGKEVPIISESTNRRVERNVTTLKLGVGFSNTNFLNGYLYKLVYYPTKCNEEQVKFLLGV